MEFLKQLFTWWNSQTIGTRLYTWRKGKLIGSDDIGNLFYENLKSKRRWVIFKNNIDASYVPSEWHGWLHHTVFLPPTSTKNSRNSWEKPHIENKTGSQLAYHPLGKHRLEAVNHSDYDAWSPENE